MLNVTIEKLNDRMDEPYKNRVLALVIKATNEIEDTAFKADVLVTVAKNTDEPAILESIIKATEGMNARYKASVSFQGGRACRKVY